MSLSLTPSMQPFIPKKPKGTAAPLSLAQRRLWFLHTLNPSSTLYNISRAWRLKGELNVPALDKALQIILHRHEALRTIIQDIDGQPIQIITPPPITPVMQMDISSSSSTDLDKEIGRFMMQERTRPFDLRHGPLIRFHLLRCGLNDHVFGFVVHHIVFDGWSLQKFDKELSTIYGQILTKSSLSLPSLPIQYGDFSYWQTQVSHSVRFSSDLAYWKSQLNGVPSFIELPTDFPRGEWVEEHDGYHRFSIPAKTLTQLKQVSRQEGVTLFMALLGAFHILLAVYSGQKDIVIGTPTANRTRVELENLLGFFVNLLPLRIDLSTTGSYREVLARVRQVCLEAYRHAELPFEYLVEMLNPPRDASRHPMVQVIFQLRNSEDIQLDLSGLSAYPFSVKRRTGNFDLHVVCEEVDSALQGFLYYPQHLFSEQSMVRLATHYQTLLESLATHPDRNIWHVSILDALERDQLLWEWNRTQAEYPQDRCVHELIEAQAARTPDAIAVMHEDDFLTYGALNRRANQLAYRLRGAGLRSDSVVAIAVKRSLDLLIALIATLKAGAAYLPLDITNPRERLAFIMKNANVSLLLAHHDVLEDWGQESISTLEIGLERINSDPESEKTLDCGALPDNLVYVIYTSGSTGQPKGVMISHRGLVNYLIWCIQAYDISERTVSVVHSSIAFDLTVTSLFAPLLVGGKVRLLDESDALEDLAATLGSDSELNFLKMTPSHLEALNHLLGSDAIASQMDTLILGGETLFAHSLAALNRQAARPNIINEYGPTETVVGCCMYEVPEKDHPDEPVPIGRPISNMQMYIMDGHLNPVPHGVRGEIYIGGVGLARGYQGRPDLTAARFIPHPYTKDFGSRLYKTGDVARYRSNGTIDCLGRSDQQVKILGYRIELEEIEIVLSQHPAVRQVVVLCHEERPGEKQLVAYWVPDGDSSIEPWSLRAYLKARIPDYMLPAVFVALNALPLTANGKLDRRALPTPEKCRERFNTSMVPPRTLEEEMLADIWAATLNLPQVGIYDNFFSLGGHSLLATRIISQIRSVFSVELPMRALFDHPTIADLAKYIIEEIKAQDA
ncbi:MAG: amino acid adenylation domain-containing protein [Nitrospirales bacterium]